MAGEPYVVYVDETGDHGLQRINPTAPVFVLCAALYPISDFLAEDQGALAKIKFDIWGHDHIIFHSRAIRRKVPPFNVCLDKDVETQLMESLGAFFDNSKSSLIAAAIHKPKLKAKYLYPANPYNLSIRFILERVYSALRDVDSNLRKTTFVFESRGTLEDAQVEHWFKRTCEPENNQ